jgi:hypothetical protein
MSTNNIQEVVVVVDTTTLDRSSHDSITGVVAIRADGVSFPDARWSDFPVVILSWWLEPISRILHGTTRIWECRFMDGPLSIRLQQEHEDSWTLTGLRDSRLELTARVSCRAFIRSLLGAGHQILRECRQRSWQGRDIEALDSAVRTIELMFSNPSPEPTPSKAPGDWRTP